MNRMKHQAYLGNAGLRLPRGSPLCLGYALMRLGAWRSTGAFRAAA
jgi:hypothetical protein